MCYLHYPSRADSPSTWRYLASVRFILQYANYWCHCTLAIHRFLTMAFPHRSSLLRSNKVISTLLALPWAFSVVVNLFPTFSLFQLRYQPSVPWGGFTIGPQKVAVFNAVFGVHIPGTVMGLCYTLSIIQAGYAVRNRQRRVGYGLNAEGLPSTQMMRTVRRRWEISRVLFLTFVWYLLCTYPVPILSLLHPEAIGTFPLLALWLRFPQYSYVGLTPLHVSGRCSDYIETLVLSYVLWPKSSE
ncbi:hypothetical protein RvY_18065 [Ramazzottius varieornatus]|uniref:G-protein coupled receptors family 1 profile domain-containing protein n=1 Tax=Ramazzottius varieornatus TaxID=947166 RepID=A0A1D1W4E5_RAMVA|nr:hypothetical protein RvY_18065 [Ramazzottius varieornatus]